MALPAREDGAAHHRDPARHRRKRGRGLSAAPPSISRCFRISGRSEPSSGASTAWTPRRSTAPPTPLAPHYSRFGVSERLLLTGHSHQAWPDCGFEGQQAAWLDAARYVDDKWEHAFDRAERVREGFARLLGDAGGGIALGAQHPRAGGPAALRPAAPDAAAAGDHRRRVPQHPATARPPRGGGPERRAGARGSARVAGGPARQRRGRSHRPGARLGRLLRHRTHRAVGLPTSRRAAGGRAAGLLVDAYHALNVVPVSLAERGPRRRLRRWRRVQVLSAGRGELLSADPARTPTSGR